MRVLVTGSRKFKNARAVSERLAQLPRQNLVIVQGGAIGVDSFAYQWAVENHVATQTYKPDWNKYGRSAGFKRNNEMLDTKPDLVLAFWDGVSNGTRHTFAGARARGIPTEVILDDGRRAFRSEGESDSSD
jgi:hypothetical protein